MNNNPPLFALDQCPVKTPARIMSVDWDMIDTEQARRLRELGFDEGVDVELLHYGPMGGDPIACQVGKMTIALRKATAAIVQVALTGNPS